MGWKDETRERVKEKKQGTNYKLETGDNCFRVMPNKRGAKFAPHIEIRIHREVGPEKQFVRCGKNLEGEGKCWLCDKKIPELAGSSSKQKRAMATAMEARDQIIVQVSQVDAKGKYHPPKPFWVSTGGARSFGTALLTTLSNPKRDYEDPIKGYNLNVERTGTGKLDTRYGPIIPDDESSKVPDAILKQTKKLEELVNEYSESSQKNAYLGRKDEPEEEEEEESDAAEDDEAGEEGEEEAGEGEGDEEELEPEDTEGEEDDEELTEEDETEEGDTADDEEGESSDEEEEAEVEEEEEPEPPKKVMKKKVTPITKKKTGGSVHKPLKKKK